MTTEIKYRLSSSSQWNVFKLNNESQEQKEEHDASNKYRIELKDILLSSMQMQNIIVLAGSGTSLGSVSGPSMWDLWLKCMKNDAGEYTEEATQICTKIKYDISSDDHVNIEVFLSKCEAFLQINEADIEVENFVNQCKQIILEKCQFDKTGNKLDGHQTFVHRLSKRRSRDPRLKIFTTNYDTCFEEAASKQGIVVIDGFSFTKPRYYDPRFFDYDIIRRSSDNNQSDSFVEGVFQIYKLHGSVNWKRDSESNFIEENIPEPENACMIFPAKGKYQQSYIQPHLELMARYLSCLRLSNTCVLITGFGFNDDHLSEPIVSAIKSNPNLKVIIADYNAELSINDPSEKYSKYWKTLSQLSLNGYDITFINASFQELATLIPDLSSLSPADKLMQDIKNIVGSK